MAAMSPSPSLSEELEGSWDLLLRLGVVSAALHLSSCFFLRREEDLLADIFSRETKLDFEISRGY